MLYDIFKTPSTYIGPGVISGLVTTSGEPHPGMVILLLVSNRVIRETVSDNSGAYSFLNLDPAVKYDVVAQDPTGIWETKVSSRRTPIEA